jgi:hypothetical protein
MTLRATARAAGLCAVLAGAAMASERPVQASGSREVRPSRVSQKGASPADSARRRQGTHSSSSSAAEREGGTSGPSRVQGRAASRPATPVPAPLLAAPLARGGHHRDARVVREPRAARAAKVPCLREPVGIERGFGGDVEPIALTRCDGRAAALAIEQLSIVVRPMNAPKPMVLATLVHHVEQEREWLPGVKLIHEGLVTRLQSVVDHFHVKKVTIVSGYRPTSLGSFHQSARAMDFHLDGVTNEALVAYCRSLADTGCGYYPNSSFVHMDVRSARAGHVYWIDASGPGEPARYVATWPLRDTPARSEIARPDPAAPYDEHTHPGAITRLGYLPADRPTAPTPLVDTQEDPFTP